MTAQEIFNQVWDWFITKRNPPGYNAATGQCKYITPDGTRCAVGAILPRTEAVDEYISTFQDGIMELMFETIRKDDLPPELRDWLHEHQEYDAFLSELQSSHDVSASEAARDGADFMQRLARRMELVAKRHDLEVPA